MTARDGSVQIERFVVEPERLTAVGAPAKVRLCWSVRGAEHVVLSGHGGVPPEQVRGLVLTVETTTTFVLTAYGRGFAEIASEQARVSVAPALAERRLPLGAIALWSGDATDIPAGWRLCDGRDGAPDLRERFVVGADGGHPAGGREQGDVHAHAVQLALRGVTEPGGTHTHALPDVWHAAEASRGEGIAGIDLAGHGALTDREGHLHRLRHTFDHATTTADALAPPWYALCYLVRTERA